MYVNFETQKSEGYDRIPVYSLIDACDVLLGPLAARLSKIYSTGKIPEQWKIAKIVPTFKKGNRNSVENYRPIANLCSASKKIEKLILKQI